jgi:hypothetical protein
MKHGVFGLGIASSIVGLVLAIKIIPVLLIAGGIGLMTASALKEKK